MKDKFFKGYRPQFYFRTEDKGRPEIIPIDPRKIPTGMTIQTQLSKEEVKRRYGIDI